MCKSFYTSIIIAEPSILGVAGTCYLRTNEKLFPFFFTNSKMFTAQETKKERHVANLTALKLLLIINYCLPSF